MAAWNAHDPQRIVALYTEEAVVEEMILGNPVYRGPDEIAAWAEASIAVFPDLQFEIDRVVSGDDHVVVEWVYRGTYSCRPASARPSRCPGSLSGSCAMARSCARPPTTT